MDRFLLVAVGGAIGSVARYALSVAVQRGVFPTGTLAVNLIGCFAIGVVGGLAARPAGLPTNTRLFLTTGLCGGFTTFSAFGFETVRLLGDGEMGLAALNIGLQVIGGLTATWVGWLVGRLL
jgi:CrcB protein